MKRISIAVMTLVLVFVLAISTDATLIDRGGGMIYSTDLNITWLKDANYAKTSGYDADGRMTWDEAMIWAENLSYGGYDDWRLPRYDPNSPQQGCNATLQHEMAYLLYVELNNCSGQYPYNFGPFINVLPDDNPDGVRWSSSEYDPSSAYYLYFSCG
jgi:hypothetical protein